MLLNSDTSLNANTPGSTYYPATSSTEEGLTVETESLTELTTDSRLTNAVQSTNIPTEGTQRIDATTLEMADEPRTTSSVENPSMDDDFQRPRRKKKSETFFLPAGHGLMFGFQLNSNMFKEDKIKFDIYSGLPPFDATL